VEAIFRALGEPEAREQFVNKNVLIGLTTVSVNPGWRTQKGWEGDVLVRADLEFKFAPPGNDPSRACQTAELAG